MPDRNLLDELMKLLNQPGPINWALASQLADHLSGPAEPVDPWLAEEYLELARFAQMHTYQATGIQSDPGTGVVLVDRKGWVKSNLRSFHYLVDPLAGRLSAESGGFPSNPLLKPLVPALLGMQMGAMVGMMSEQVLGLFDTGIPAAEPTEITVLLPNLESFSSEHGLDSRQVRLWSALHEVIHDALLRRSWVRSHLIELCRSTAGAVELDIATMADWYENLADPGKLEELFQKGGAAGLFGGPIGEEALAPIRNVIAVLEGYGSFLVDQASGGLLPDLSSIRSAMSSHHQDRNAHSAPGSLFKAESSAGLSNRVTSLCAEIERRWGRAAVDRIWERPENLPSPPEWDDATGWAARVLLDNPFG